jgi:hypothetical protein
MTTTRALLLTHSLGAHKVHGLDVVKKIGRERNQELLTLLVMLLVMPLLLLLLLRLRLRVFAGRYDGVQVAARVGSE